MRQILFYLCVNLVISYNSIASTILYSGAFDPPSVAHIAIIKALLLEVKKNETLVVVVNSDGKNFKTSSDQRVKMLQEVTKIYGKRIQIIASDYTQKGILINELGEKHKDFKIGVGEDSFFRISEESRNNKKLKFIVVQRGLEDFPKEHYQKFISGQVKVIKVEGIEGVSSTVIREGLATSSPDTDEYLEPEVKKFIEKYSLYPKALRSELLELQKKLIEESFQRFLKESEYFSKELKGKLTSKNLIFKLDPQMSDDAIIEQWVTTATKAVKSFSLNIDINRFSSYTKFLLKGTHKDGYFIKFNFLKLKTDLTINHSQNNEPSFYIEKKIKQRGNQREDWTLNIKEYVEERFPLALQIFTQKNHVPIYLHLGDSRTALQLHVRMGFTEVYSLKTSRGLSHRDMWLISNEAGQYRLILSNIGGKDRLEHVSAWMGAMTGLTSVWTNPYEVPRKLYEFKEPYKNIKFNSEKDKMIIGYKSSIKRKLLEDEPVGSDSKVKMYPIVEGILDIEMIENLESQRKTVLVKAVYGDDLLVILNDFYKKGIRNIKYFGTAGGLDSKIHVGDILLPTSIATKNGESINFKNNFLNQFKDGEKIFNDSDLQYHHVKHGWVQSIIDETYSYMNQLKNVGVQSIDVELKYLIEFAQNKSDLSVSSVLFASDLPFGSIKLDEHNETSYMIDRSFAHMVEPVIESIKNTMAANEENKSINSAEIFDCILNYTKESKNRNHLSK